MSDPTRPLIERTPDELGEFLDDHLLMAFEAAHMLTDAPFSAEDLIRNRLVALADTYTDRAAVAQENSNRRTGRLLAALQEET